MTAKTTEAAHSPETITAYKGFNKDWQCRGFQYQVGGTFKHHGVAKACESGFHACEYPLDVFTQYPPATSRFAVVEQSGDLSRSDSKIASTSISIVAEIRIDGLVKAAIDHTSGRCKPIDPSSPASATGDLGAAAATGDQGAAAATGYQGAAVAAGDQGAASATGTRGAASATGEKGAAVAAGYQGAAAATGYLGAAAATGTAAVAVATGWCGSAQAADGCAIVLVFRDEDGNIAHIRASKVGENGIKAGFWYTLNSEGQFIEAEVGGPRA